MNTMYYNESNKTELSISQKNYLTELRKELRNIELLGKNNTTQWWVVAESIDEIENNN